MSRQSLYSGERYEKAVAMLQSTTDSLSAIAKQVGLASNPSAMSYIQDHAIAEGRLDPKFKRLYAGVIQLQYDKAVDLLSTTQMNLTEIAQKVGFSSSKPIINIQGSIIKEGRLDPKYRRLNSGVVQWQYDKAIDLLKTTQSNLTEIAQEVGFSSRGPVKFIQNRAIKEGRLDPKYKRLGGGYPLWQYDKAVGLLETTQLNLTEIAKEAGFSGATLVNIQNRAIAEGRLDPKYRRVAGGYAQWQYDKAIDLLSTTQSSLSEIAREVGFSSNQTIMHIQNRAIAEGHLDPKYRRVAGGYAQWQYDKAVDLLSTTQMNLLEIAQEVGYSSSISVKHIQNRAIAEGHLDPKYKRLGSGYPQWQYDKAIDLLKTTQLSLSEIAKEAGFCGASLRDIQNRAIKEGKLDPSRKRPLVSNGSVNDNYIKSAPSFAEFVETDEKAKRALRLFYDGESIDPAFALVVAVCNPDRIKVQDALDYLPSLGPYLGKYKPQPADIVDVEGTLSDIPLPALDKDERLRRVFYVMARNYYLDLIDDYPSNGDRQAFVSLLHDRRAHEENPSLRWLYESLYDEFGEFFRASEDIELRRRGNAA